MNEERIEKCLRQVANTGTWKITCWLNTDPEIPVTRHFCMGITFFANNKRGCTSETHDVLVGTYKNVFLQGSLLIYHSSQPGTINVVRECFCWIWQDTISI